MRHACLTKVFALGWLAGLQATCVGQFTTVYNVPGDTPPTVIGSNTTIKVQGVYSPLDSPWVLGPTDQSGSNIRLDVGGAIPNPPFSPIPIAGHFTGDLIANSGVAISTIANNSTITGDIQLLGNATLTSLNSSTITGDITAGGASVVSGGNGTIRGTILATDASTVTTGQGAIEGDITLYDAAKFRMDNRFTAYYSGNIVAHGPDATVELVNGGASGSLRLLNGAVLRAGQGASFSGVITADASTILLEGGFGFGFSASEIQLNNGSFLDTGTDIFTTLRSVVHVNQGSTLVVKTDFESPGGFGSPFDPVPSIFVNDGGLLQLAGGLPSYGGVVIEAGGRAEISSGGATIEARAGADANITGGWHSVTARDGALVTATGGYVGYAVDPGADLRVAGGAFRQQNTFGAGYGATLVGDDFLIGGAPVSGLLAPGDRVTIDVSTGVDVRGVLANGTPFLLSPDRGDNVQSLTLELAPLPAPPLGTPLRASQTPGLVGLRVGQSVEVDAGGSLTGHFRAADQTSVLLQAGGIVNSGFESHGGTLDVDGGEMKGSAYLFGGQLDMSAGKAATVYLRGGQGANVSGGAIDTLELREGPWAQTGGAVTTLKTFDSPSVAILAGSVGSLEANASNVVVDGGVITSSLKVDAESTLSWSGAEFWLNGAPVDSLGAPGDTVTIPYDSSRDVLSGVQSDGTPFVFYGAGSMSVRAPAVTLMQRIVTPPAEEEIVYSSPVLSNAPRVIRAGQILTVTAGGRVGSGFKAMGGSTLVIEHGAEAGSGLLSAGATVEVSGKSGYVLALNGSDITVHDGGELLSNSQFHPGSRLTVERGGIVRESDFYSTAQAVVGGILGRRRIESVMMFGEDSQLEVLPSGVVGGVLDFAPGALAEVRGGLSTTITTSPTTSVKIYGDAFSIGGIPIEFDATGRRLLTDFSAGADLVGVSEGGALVIADRNSSIAPGSVELIQTAPAYGEPGVYEVPATPGGATQYTPWTGASTVHRQQTLYLRDGASLPMVDVGPGGRVVVGDGGTIGTFGGRVVGGELEFQTGAVADGEYAVYGGGVIKMIGTKAFVKAGVGGTAILDAPGLSFFQIDGGRIEFRSGSGRINNENGSGGEVLLTGGRLDKGDRVGIDYTNLTVTIIEGSIGGGAKDFQDSTIRAVAGNAGSPVLYSSELEISGTAAASYPKLYAGSRFRQSGSSTVGGVTAYGETEAYFSGGTVGSYTFAAGSEMHLFAKEFLVDGTPIDGLQMGETITVSQRNVTITAIWQNGGQQNFNTANGIAPDALLTVTLVGAPGDYNYDGLVDAADYTVWRDAFELGESYGAYRHADGDFNGVVDERDREVWAANYGRTFAGTLAASVPEPVSAGMSALMGLLSALKRRRPRSNC